MASVRLLHFTTLELCEFPVGWMPPYLAISHVWSEGLFAPSHITHVKDCKGFQLIQSFLEQHSTLSTLQYCWVDTWCINQDDAEDKACQMPMMGDIYKQAEIVVVAVNQYFSFSSADWDLAMVNLHEAFQYVEDDDLYNTPNARASYASSKVIENVARAASMLDELTRIPWFGRVWTAQEYILAKDIMWIGSDRNFIRMSYDNVRSLNKLGASTADTFQPRGNVAALISMSRIRTGRSHPTVAMRLANHRKCLSPEDEIYGLMAASEVVVSPIYNIGVKVAWQIWWEKAIESGHIMWAMMRVSASRRHDTWHQGGNCIMPSADFRHDAMNWWGVEAGVRPYAAVELCEGTASFVGRIAGTCKIEMYLGEFGEGVVPDVVDTVSGDVGVMTRFCEALTIGEIDAAEISAWVSWACDDYRSRKDGQPAHNGKRQQILDSKRLIHEFVSNLRYGRTYLATLINQFGSTNILVNADEVPRGELLAIDVGARMQKSTQRQGIPKLSEHQVFVIVHIPPDQDVLRDALHKVGTTSNIFVPAFDEVQRATDYGGTVLEDKFERYRMGGAACSYCHPRQRSGTSNPVGGHRRSRSKPWIKLKKWARLQGDESRSAV